MGRQLARNRWLSGNAVGIEDAKDVVRDVERDSMRIGTVASDCTLTILPLGSRTVTERIHTEAWLRLPIGDSY